ncbi:DNA alkylation repair protein [Candidatus Daviesbacteria bacterium]|nr:DNA alkylation repair protein [Candidatus Daviesbacteria bacterium]
MDKLHSQLLIKIKELNQSDPKHNWVSSYLGTPHLRYGLKSPVLRAVCKTFSKDHQDLTKEDLLVLVDSLFKGESFEERATACYFLEYFPFLREKISPNKLDSWLNNLVGWAEVDTLCAGPFQARDFLDNWLNWKNLIIAFSKSQNISKRRASLVLLVIPVRDSDQTDIADLAFRNIDKLKSEKDILITKATSWLLRSLIKNHQSRVEQYLKDNLNSLPKIAVRETQRKLQTGKK